MDNDNNNSMIHLIYTPKKRGGRFRQTGFTGGNIIVGTVLGILSGKYIFEEPLQHYWAEKHAAEQIAAGGGKGDAGSGGVARSTKQ